MLLLRYRGPIFSLSFLVMAALVLGCGSRREYDDDSDPGAMPQIGSRGATTDLGKAIPPGTATVRGRITLDGNPDLAKLNQEFVATMQKLASPSDRPHCLNVGKPEQAQEQDWKVGPGNGLGEVFVYLRPQKGYFAVDPNDERILEIRKKGPAVIDQPHCTYVPHVVQLLPSFRDLNGKEEKDVQKLEIKNTANIGHNVKFPDGKNEPISSGGGQKFIDTLKADYTPLTISCSIHPWMNANILVLDHPYSAITDKDGKFEIKNAPEGKLQLIVWHGKSGFITKNKARGEEIELKKGEPLEKNYTVTYGQ